VDNPKFIPYKKYHYDLLKQDILQIKDKMA